MIYFIFNLLNNAIRPDFLARLLFRSMPAMMWHDGFILKP